ncbi:peptidoglycan recognition protein family protein [Agathobaculum sp. LCP25S3_E8]|uniref:peptidoglycan recognition protein family protein n=1 Tax=Agathobaculum sp. LCP25S3_E8 TaxID=3438735 RepID=UPI003F93D788
MKTQCGFTLMTVAEFENWIASQRVTRGIQLVQLHHTWSPAYAQFNGSNHFTLQSNMKSYHLSIGYADIAQNLTIFPDGQVMTGRSLNTAPAGCVGANTNGICIENIGNFDVGGDTMTDAHKDAIVRVTAALLKKFGLSPESGVTYHAWWTEGGTSLGTYIAGKSCKTCPGTAFFGGNTRASYDKCLKPLLMAAMNGSYQEEEDDEVIEQKTVLVDGKEYKCECIEKDGHNFVKMRSLSQAGYDVVFDAARQLPAMTAPQCRAFVPDRDEAVQDAIDTLQETCGLEEQTIAYMRKYKYGDELVTKLAAAMK